MSDTTDDRKECKVPACRELIPQYEIMCAAHWALVPADLKRDLQGTLITMEREQTEASMAAYKAAVREAIAIVERTT